MSERLACLSGPYGRTIPLASPWLLSLVVIVVGLPSGLCGEEPATDEASAPDSKSVSYYEQIRPIFQAHCQGCHQPAKSSGGYIMTDFQAMLAGGELGLAAVVPGDPDASYLMEQITPVDGYAEMPKDKPPLSEAEVALIARWIQQGAEDDTPESARQRYDRNNPPAYSAAPVITALRVSPDGRTLAVSGYHEVLLLPMDAVLDGKRKIAARLVGMSERIESVAFSPDGQHLAVAGGSPGRFGEVQIWNLKTHELERSLPVGHDTCYGVTWSSDGKLVAFGCPDHTVRAIEVETGEQVFFNRAHNDWVMDTVFSTEQSHLVSVSRDRSMKLYELETQRFIDNITSITPGALQGGLHAVDRHPQRDELVIGGADGTPKIYRMFREKDRKIGDDFNRIHALPAMAGRVFDVSYSSDGKMVIAGSSDVGHGEVRVFSASDGKELVRAKDIDSPVFTVTFDEDGSHFFAGGLDGNLYVGLVDSGELVARFLPVPISQQEGIAEAQ